ncbi:hypothetical protein EV363DRAFT_1103340, partial [Boletus edulis]
SAGIQLQEVLHLPISTCLALIPPPSLISDTAPTLIRTWPRRSYMFGSAAVLQPKGRILYTMLPVSSASTHGRSPLISFENRDARIVNPNTDHCFVLHGANEFRNVGSPRTALVQCNQVYISN